MSNPLRVLCAFAVMTMLSCKSIEPPIADPFGTVITAQRDVIQVAHPVINKDPGSQLAAWYYCPGHVYVLGDRFPDFSKHTTLKTHKK